MYIWNTEKDIYFVKMTYSNTFTFFVTLHIANFLLCILHSLMSACALSVELGLRSSLASALHHHDAAMP